MPSTLLLAAAIVCNANLAPTAVYTHNGALELQVRVDASRFLVYNPTDRPELIVFSDATRGTRAEVVIAAYQEVEYRFLTRAIEGLEFEAIAIDAAGGLVRSGRLSLEYLRDKATEGVWIETSHAHAHAWAHHATSWSTLDFAESVPTTGAHALCSPPLVPPPAPHVPVITPSSDQYGDLPPDIESTPLPPV